MRFFLSLLLLCLATIAFIDIDQARSLALSKTFPGWFISARLDPFLIGVSTISTYWLYCQKTRSAPFFVISIGFVYSMPFLINSLDSLQSVPRFASALFAIFLSVLPLAWLLYQYISASGWRSTHS